MCDRNQTAEYSHVDPADLFTCVQYHPHRFPRCAWMSDLWSVGFLKLRSIKADPADNLSTGTQNL